MAAVTPRVLLGAALVSLGLVGCAHGGSPAATSTAPPATTTTSAGWSRPDAPPDPHTLLRAGDAALATVPDAKLIFIESETDDAGTWKVRVATSDGAGQQVKIGADGITVLVGPAPVNDGDADESSRRDELTAAKLDYRAAVEAVLAAMPNGSITQLKLAGGDAPVWEADAWDTYLVEHHVRVNAVSGDVEANTQG